MTSDNQVPIPPVPLMMAEHDSEVEIIEIKGGRELQARLSAMGLLPGVKVRIIKKCHKCGYVLMIKDSKLMLGRGMVQKIMVKHLTS